MISGKRDLIFLPAKFLNFLTLQNVYESRKERGRIFQQTSPTDQRNLEMNKLIATLGLIAVVATPVLALDENNDSGSQANQSLKQEISPPQSLAALPGYVSGDMADMAIGAACASSLKLSLSDEQLEKMAKLKADFSDLASQKKAQLHSLQRQLKDSLSSESLDKSKALDLQSKVNTIRNDLANAQLAMRIDSLQVLSSEQKQKLRHAALERQVFGKKGKGHHKGPGGKHGFRKGGEHRPHGPGAGPVGFEGPESPENNS